MNRKSICLSMDEKDICTFDNVVELLTQINGYRFTRTSALLFLIRYYLNDLDFSVIKGELAENLKTTLPFDHRRATDPLTNEVS